jgi:hypothetical protein
MPSGSGFDPRSFSKLKRGALLEPFCNTVHKWRRDHAHSKKILSLPEFIF